MASAKFKKGDYVVVKEPKYGLPYFRENFRKNVICKIRCPDNIRGGLQTYEVYGSIYVLYEDEIGPVQHKYKPGDFVCVVDTSKFPTDRGFHVGDTVKIKELDTVQDGIVTYAICNSKYVLREDEIEPIKDKTVTITFDVSLSNKKDAHRIAHQMVEKAYNDAVSAARPVPKPKKHEDWTEDETELARRLIANWVTDIVMDGGDVFWQLDEDSKFQDDIQCFYYPRYYNHNKGKTGTAHKMPGDYYNVWIGKCVSLAKAMGNPIPEFIRKKNLEVD